LILIGLNDWSDWGENGGVIKVYAGNGEKAVEPDYLATSDLTRSTTSRRPLVISGNWSGLNVQ